MSMRAYYPNSLYAKSHRLQVPVTKATGSTGTNKDPRIRRRATSFVLISSEFIRRVEDMEQTVLIPTKLLDIELSGQECQEVPQFVVFNGNSNLYQVFNLIKNFKVKLEAMNIDEESISNGLSPMDIDDSLALTASQLSTLDSGNWSSGSAGSSSQSEEESSSLSCSSDNETSASEASYRVKRTLHTAKGLCSFLNELLECCDYLVQRYCEEFQCDA